MILLSIPTINQKIVFYDALSDSDRLEDFPYYHYCETISKPFDYCYKTHLIYLIYVNFLNYSSIHSSDCKKSTILVFTPVSEQTITFQKINDYLKIHNFNANSNYKSSSHNFNCYLSYSNSFIQVIY